MSRVKARGSGKFKKSKLLRLGGQSILSVGCGEGKYLEFCRASGRRAVGVDISESAVEQAQKRSGGRALVADALNIPFADKSFDTVTLWDALEHVEDDCAALKESLRVARQNVLVSVPGEDAFPDYSSGVIFRTYRDPTHRRYYNLQRIENLLSLCSQSDFTVEKFDRVRPALLYRRVGIPRGLLSMLDKALWLLSLKSAPFLRNYFIEIRLAGGSAK